MNIEKMREEFEAWANTHYLLSELSWSFVDGEYEEPEMQYAWEAWQASRELLAIELPEEVIKNAEKWKIVQRCMDMLQSDERNASIWSACSLLLISTAHKLNSALSTVLEEGVTIGEEKIGDWRVTVERVATDKEG